MYEVSLGTSLAPGLRFSCSILGGAVRTLHVAPD